MTEEIDYQALVQQLQEELTQARLQIVKLRYARNPLHQLKGADIRQFVQRNYLLIILALYILSCLPGLLKALRGLFTTKEKE